MLRTGRLTHVLAPITLLLLAACQTTPTKTDSTVSNAPTSGSNAQAVTPPAGSTTAPAQQEAGQNQQMGAPVGIFLADTKTRAEWTRVEVQPNGVLYVNPNPVLSNEDLVGVQAGRGDSPEVGLLALDLSPEATARLAKLTSDNPNMRLALVVGNTMLAAPGYSQPVTEGRLVFMVGTEANALAAAQAIAGDSARVQQAPAR